jgi:L-asparaginase II
VPDPISVLATRGSVVEARHVVHAVAFARDGTLVAVAGDSGIMTFLRSSAKPLQVLPLVRARPDLPDRSFAIACSSHLGLPEQLAAVRELLAAAPADEAELETGPEPSAIEHTCSGKHAGMLALCRARGWESQGYSAADHPCQQAMLSEIAAAVEVEVGSIPIAWDGCGLPTFGLSLEQAALLYGRLPDLEGGQRVVDAMRAHTDLLRGPIAADVKLIRALPGWVAKGGAEGLFCAVSPEGLGVALKVEDGAFRAILPALGAFLRRLGLEAGDLGSVRILNSHAMVVGALETC